MFYMIGSSADKLEHAFVILRKDFAFYVLCIIERLLSRCSDQQQQFGARRHRNYVTKG